MSKAKLTLDTIAHLGDGAGELVCNSALRQAIADTDDRGADGKDRVVTIKVSMRKLKSGQAEIELECGVKLPVYRTSPTAATIKLDHQDKCSTLVFEKDTRVEGEVEA